MGHSSEFELLQLLTKGMDQGLAPGVLGVGDDCAVLPCDRNGSGVMLLSVDTHVEGVHFRRSYCSPQDIGWRAVATAASDLAAMGAEPLGCLLSLQVPSDFSDAYLAEVYEGVREITGSISCPLLGGDTVTSSSFTLSVTVLGRSELPLPLRSKAMIGDEVWVSGALGGASLGFSILENDQTENNISAERVRLARRHLRPIPQVALGRRLVGTEGLHAMIDLSDGLFSDATHIAKSSAVSIELDWESIPLDSAVSPACPERLAALTHGDDYELLFTVPPQASEGVSRLVNEDGCRKLRKIGYVCAPGEHAVLLRTNGLRVPVNEFLAQNGVYSGGYVHR